MSRSIQFLLLWLLYFEITNMVYLIVICVSSLQLGRYCPSDIETPRSSSAKSKQNSTKQELCTWLFEMRSASLPGWIATTTDGLHDEYMKYNYEAILVFTDRW